MVLEFPSESAAREARPPVGHVLSSEPATHYDFDTVQAWCASTAAPLDCATLLNAWNLLGDLPHTENLFTWADVRAKGVYDKLFFGCNLPAITPGVSTTFRRGADRNQRAQARAAARARRVSSALPSTTAQLFGGIGSGRAGSASPG